MFIKQNYQLCFHSVTHWLRLSAWDVGSLDYYHSVRRCCISWVEMIREVRLHPYYYVFVLVLVLVISYIFVFHCVGILMCGMTACERCQQHVSLETLSLNEKLHHVLNLIKPLMYNVSNIETSSTWTSWAHLYAIDKIHLMSSKGGRINLGFSHIFPNESLVLSSSAQRLKNK